MRSVGFLDRLFGRRQEPPPRVSRTPSGQPSDDQPSDQPLTDEQAIERYKYMLRTAPPDAIEQAHEEAFAKLTPEQRRLALEQLSAVTPEDERAGEQRDDPRTLARMATRAEVRQPGTLVNLFGRPTGTPGYGAYGGGMGFGGTLLSTIAGAFIGTMVADALFNHMAYDQGYADGAASDQQEDGGQDGGDANDQDIADAQTMDDSSQQDWGGDLGGDFGGGDFGGGDFGGGDF